MNNNDAEHLQVERLLKQVRLSGPTAELKKRVLQAAQKARRDATAGVPWRIPIRRLAASAAVAAILVSLANLHCDRTFARRSIAIPIAGSVEPCDLDVTIGPAASLIRHAVTATGLDRTDTATSVDYLERVRRALGETERDEAPDDPAPAERRSRLPRIPSSLNS